MDKYSSPTIHRSSYPPPGGSGPGGYNPGGYNPGGYGQGGYSPGGYQQSPGYPQQQYGMQPQPGAPFGLAGAGSRILAFLIDGFIPALIVLLAYVLFFVFAIGGAATQSDAGSTAAGLVGTLIFIVLLGAGLAFSLINQIYLAGKNNGQTIGKKMMGIRIVKQDGTTFGYMDAFLRNIIGYWISGLICDLGFFWALFDSNKQGWHDKIFHTYVVSS